MKKKIDVFLRSIDLCDLDNQTLDNVIDNLEKLKKENGGYSLWLSFDRYSEGLSVDLYGSREETDEEYKERIEAEKKMKKLKDARKNEEKKHEDEERALLAKLKEKYE